MSALLNSRDGLSDDNVSTIYCDHRGVLWLTTVTGARIPIRQRPDRSRPPAAAGRSPAHSRQPSRITPARSGSAPTIRAWCASPTGKPRGSPSRKDCATTAFKRSTKIETESVDRHHQRTQPLGRLALQELLPRRRPLLRLGSRHRAKTTMATCWWARIAASIASTTASS